MAWKGFEGVAALGFFSPFSTFWPYCWNVAMLLCVRQQPISKHILPDITHGGLIFCPWKISLPSSRPTLE